jgi:phosphohistidine phosphatase
MLQLLVMRHAKASRENASDFERPLTSRGRSDSERIARLLADTGLIPERVCASSSTRTAETVALMLPQWRPPCETDLLEEMYLAPAETLLDVLAAHRGDRRRIMLVAHNPGIEEFCRLTTGRPENFPTAAIALVESDAEDWAAFATATQPAGRLKEIWRPKELVAD